MEVGFFHWRPYPKAAQKVSVPRVRVRDHCSRPAFVEKSFLCGLRVLRHAHARFFAWLLGTCISETTADIAGNQTPMPEDQRELYTMQTTSDKVSRRQRHRGG